MKYSHTMQCFTSDLVANMRLLAESALTRGALLDIQIQPGKKATITIRHDRDDTLAAIRWEFNQLVGYK